MTENFDAKSLTDKLLKFCGFTHHTKEENKPLVYYLQEYSRYTTYDWWEFKDKSLKSDELPDLLNSLDAQHKYIWPKLRELGFMIRYQYSELRDNDTGKIISDWTYWCEIYDVSYKTERAFHNFRFDGYHKDSPAIACALAVEKLIDEINKETK